MTDADAGAGDAPASPATPPHRLVAGTVAIDDLDAFLATLDEVAAETGAVVQAFDADLIVSAAHLCEATRLAARAIARDEAVARDPGVEVMLYAAGSRQIDRAFALGVSEGEQRTVVLVADFGAVPGADRPAADLDAAAASVEDLLEPATGASAEGFDPSCDAERVREFYEVGDREMAATAGGLADIVRERVALLDVEK
ncbi:KEOPS complex subunit Cgi121 [Halorubrum lipolyticum]|uniref:KEOPS complex Cgi121-like subunit n=1 Tax=Halorubrum lipolyticum DSM 21995 TaxID=1227482 RepID=M0NSP1_9EURY|nr:KEOPS complex subunit Cgi121 [Halorubrum lipolyticum]EMA60254.1 KEOPS complex Cgi121-like subunit [Halorubrum lipolyticum DSM 21995]